MEPAVFIDLYCERTAPGFWNEPVNALSNISFLLAAFFAYQIARKREQWDWPEMGLIFLAGSIGIGSFLFHTFASSWAELADVIPIWSFVACMILLVIYRLSGENIWRTLRTATLVIGSVVLVFVFSSKDVTSGQEGAETAFNGSLQYLPALIALLVFTLISALRRHPATRLLGVASAVFLLSLVFRAIDLDTCTQTVIGTHFLWHLLNGLMIWLLLYMLVTAMPPGGQR